MPTFRSVKSRLAITLGDPAGIGPEVTVRALQKLRDRSNVSFLVLGKAPILNAIAQKLKLKVRFKDISSLSSWTEQKEFIPCFLKGVLPAKFMRGKSKTSLTRLAVQSIELSVQLAIERVVDAVVTAPINKAALKKAGFNIPGHTEFMAKLSGTKDFEMMLIGGPLRVVLVTRHTPIKKIASLLTKEGVRDTILLTDRELRRSFGIAKPRIVVCGLNPHAGEEGTIGIEEISIIEPGVALARKRSKALISGPLSPDALFYDAYQGRFDAVVCMYHDQGLIPLKMISRGHGVNVTLGLPFVRTSPDHGTAYDIANKFVADSGSMEEAIKTAIHIAQKRGRYGRV